MKTISATTTLLIVLVLGLSSVNAQTIQASANDKDDFTNASLHDRYGFHSLALRVDVSSPTANNTIGAGTAFAVSGFYQFDGDGSLIGHDWVSTGNPAAPVVERRYTGKYTVNSDGTGTLQLTFPGSSFSPVGKFTIVDSGKAIEIVFLVPGNMNTFELRKQHTREDRD